MRRQKGEILAFDFAKCADRRACKDASRDECEGDGQDKLRAHLSHLSQKFQTGLPFSISGQQSEEDPLPPGSTYKLRGAVNETTSSTAPAESRIRISPDRARIRLSA
jgi:hypothetical protein